MCGTIDKDHQYHPFCVVIIKHVESCDYAFMFRTLKDLLLMIFDFYYKPTILVADAAGAISNGFEMGLLLLC